MNWLLKNYMATAVTEAALVAATVAGWASLLMVA